MRAGFLTCVQLGLSCMEAIYAVGGKLSFAYTLQDHLAPNKSGRVWIDDFCSQNSLPLLKLRHVNDGFLASHVHNQQLDWLFIIGWSQIAGSQLLQAPKHGALGIHPTLLPSGRGRASIPWAILNNLNYTGVSLFKLDEGVDTGPILQQEVLHLSPTETATSLYSRVNKAHVTLITSIWSRLEQNSFTLTPQDHSKATYWPGRTPQDGQILPRMSISETDRLVRATTHPYPGAFWLGSQFKYIVWKGSFRQQPGSLAIPCSDGIYWATEYEPIPL